MKIKKVIWEGPSRLWPGVDSYTKQPDYRAVFDGFTLIFEKSSSKDAMGNPIWEGIGNNVPTEFLLQFARILYNK